MTLIPKVPDDSHLNPSSTFSHHGYSIIVWTDRLTTESNILFNKIQMSFKQSGLLDWLYKIMIYKVIEPDDSFTRPQSIQLCYNP